MIPYDSNNKRFKINTLLQDNEPVYACDLQERGHDLKLSCVNVILIVLFLGIRTLSLKTTSWTLLRFAWNLYFNFYETNSYDIFITKCVVVYEPGGRITSCYQAEDIDSPNSNRLKVTRSQGKAVQLILSEYATARVEISLLNMLYWYYNINTWTANRLSIIVMLKSPS